MENLWHFSKLQNFFACHLTFRLLLRRDSSSAGQKVP